MPENKPTFEEWYATVPEGKNDTTNYSLREAYNNLPYEIMKQFAESSAHLPDTYKKPSHPTFSEESNFSNNDTTGGRWSYEDGKDVFTPSPFNIQQMGGVENYQAWMQRNEPGVRLNIPKLSDPNTWLAMRPKAKKGMSGVNNKEIEAEGGELIIQNEFGDNVIVPRKDRRRVQKYINDGEYSMVDSIVSKYPKFADYAEDGSIYPDIPPKLDITVKGSDVTLGKKINPKSVAIYDPLNYDHPVDESYKAENRYDAEKANIELFDATKPLNIDMNDAADRYKESQKKTMETAGDKTYRQYVLPAINEQKGVLNKQYETEEDEAPEKLNYKELDLNNYKNKQDVEDVQQMLVDKGYNLGKYGVNKDGVDGLIGKYTRRAINTYNSKIKEVNRKIEQGRPLIESKDITVDVSEDVSGVLSKEEYQKQISDNYKNYIGKGVKTPYTSMTKEGNQNCIHGVCDVLGNISDKKMNYIGNATFADNMNKEGYVRVNPHEESFEVGDIVQYTMPKKYSARFEGNINKENKDDPFPYHAKIILGKTTNKDGEVVYEVGNNSGSDNFVVQQIKEKDLLESFNMHTDSPGRTLFINRYDPEEAYKEENKDEIFRSIVSGNNKYADEYKKYPEAKGVLNVLDKEEFKRANELYEIYSDNYQNIGRGANMPPEVLDKLFNAQVGIRETETYQGGIRAKLKQLIPDKYLSTARMVNDKIDGTDYTWKDDYWDRNINNVQSEFKDSKDFKKYLNAKKGQGIKVDPYNTPRSKGEFQQKSRGKRGEFYGYDFDTIEGQFLNSLTLAIDNYHTIKDKYPNLSEDELVDLTTLMHNAPSKAMTQEYVDWYLKNKEIDYANLVNAEKGILNK